MIKLTYFDKISPYGIYVENIGNIHSPFLKDIAEIGYNQYQYYLFIMLCTPETYFSNISKSLKVDNIWEKLDSDQKKNINMFDILIESEQTRMDLINSLSLFIPGEMEWDSKKKIITINKKKDKNKISVSGYIDRSNYGIAVNVCLQLADVNTSDIPEEKPKFKTEKDKIFYEKFLKKKKEFSSKRPIDKRFELENMISLLCTFHQSLNYSNIFDLTIVQVKDTFAQLMKYKRTKINETNYAVWGGKYDPSIWLDRIDNVGG